MKAISLSDNNIKIQCDIHGIDRILELLFAHSFAINVSFDNLLIQNYDLHYKV